MIVTLVLIYTRLSYTCTVIVFILHCQGFMLGYSSKINNPIPNLIEVIVVIVVFK